MIRAEDLVDMSWEDWKTYTIGYTNIERKQVFNSLKALAQDIVELKGVPSEDKPLNNYLNVDLKEWGRKEYHKFFSRELPYLLQEIAERLTELERGGCEQCRKMK